jgi:hypothetical protein
MTGTDFCEMLIGLEVFPLHFFALLSLHLTFWEDCTSTSVYSQIKLAIWNACKQHNDTNKHWISNITYNIPHTHTHTHTHIKHRSYLLTAVLLGLVASRMCHWGKWAHSTQHFSHPITQHHIPEDLNLQNYSMVEGVGGWRGEGGRELVGVLWGWPYSPLSHYQW